MSEDEEDKPSRGERASGGLDEEAGSSSDGDGVDTPGPQEKKTPLAKAERRPLPRRGTAAKGKRTRAKAQEPADEPVVASSAPGAVTVAEERSARRALGAGVSLALVGLALVGIGPSEAGMAATLAGLLTLIYGIHTFGRLGPEPAK